MNGPSERMLFVLKIAVIVYAISQGAIIVATIIKMLHGHT